MIIIIIYFLLKRIYNSILNALETTEMNCSDNSMHTHNHTYRLTSHTLLDIAEILIQYNTIMLLYSVDVYKNNHQRFTKK